MTDTTLRTATPEVHLRNLRNRQAQLTLRKIMGLITPDEQRELNELTEKLFKIAHNQGASQ